MELISQAAEAKIYRKDDVVIKERIIKSYRHPQLDNSIRKFRTKREAKILKKLEEVGFSAPRVSSIDEKEMKIEMNFIKGELLKDVFSKDYKKLAKEIGKKIALMHNQDIVHGDLTTANMIFDNEVVFIDFGLAQFSDKIEDKAVDLHLLENALEAVHFDVYPKAFSVVVDSYKKESKNSEAILKRLEIVNGRGRNKQK